MVQGSVRYTDISVCILIILLFILFHKYGNVSLLVALTASLGGLLYMLSQSKKPNDSYQRTKEGMSQYMTLDMTEDVTEDIDQDLGQDMNQILQKPVELVVARYNETLHWLNTDPFRKYPAVIYNKGDPMETYDYDAPVYVETLPNVGKCDHTYLYHIIKNYDHLADVTVFLPGSAVMKHKIGKTKKMMNLLETEPNKTIFITNNIPNVGNALYNFALNEYKTSEQVNYLKNPETKLYLSKIRPFGKWFKHHFPQINIHHVSYMGIMAISKKHIQQHPKKYYENLIKELETSSNPEVGHYFERAWLAIFHPLPDAIIFTSN
jgi:hypothetical protein